MSNFVGKDLFVALFLEDSKNTCGRSRKLVAKTIESRSSDSYSMECESGEEWKGFFLTVQPVFLNFISGRYEVHATISFVGGQSVSVYKEFNSGLAWFSIRDFVGKADFSLEASSIEFTITNRTDDSIRVQYLTLGPLFAVCEQNGLKYLDYGVRAGEDDEYPDFGVCQDYGSMEFKDPSKFFLGMVSSPEDYGLGNIKRLSMRVEAYLGNCPIAFMETDKFNYAEGGRFVSVSLKSPLQRLSSYYGFCKRVYTSEFSLLGYWTEFADSLWGEPSELFSLTSLSDSNWRNITFKAKTLTRKLSALEFLTYCCQASFSNVLLNVSMSTSMKYRLYSVCWLSRGGPAPSTMHLSSSTMPNVEPKDIIGEVDFSSVQGNFVDKVTYTPYEVRVAEKSVSTTTVFNLIRKNQYASESSDKQAYLEKWLEASGVQSLPSGEVAYGAKFPMPSDFRTDPQTQRYGVSQSELDDRARRAITRGFLWRFSFNKDFSGANGLSTPLSTLGSTISITEQRAKFKSPDSSGSSYGLIYTGNADKVGTSRSFSYGAVIEQNGIQTATSHTVSNTGVSKRTTFKFPIFFDNLPSFYSLYANLEQDAFLFGGESIQLKLEFSYWFTEILGGKVCEGYAESKDYLTAMSVVSAESDETLGAPTYIPRKTWEASLATKLSEYLTVQKTSEQNVLYPSVTGQQGWVAPSGVDCMLWSAFGEYQDDYEPFALHMSVPAHDKRGTSNVYRIGFHVGSSDVEDYDGHSGSGINSNFDCQPIIWGTNWYGADDDSYGGYAALTTQTKQASDAVMDERGNLCIAFQLPSASTLKNAILSSDNNFIGVVSEEQSGGSNPGSYRANDANPYFCLWGPSYAFSVLNKSLSQEQDASGIPNLDGDGYCSWFDPIPLYGYVVKDVKVTATARYGTVEALPQVVAQYNGDNHYNYDMQTNGLMTNYAFLNGSDLCSSLAQKMGTMFSNGKRIARISTKALFSIRMASGVVRHRAPYVGDSLSGAYPKVTMGGVAQSLCEDVSSWFLREIEIVYDNGSLKYNLGLFER